MAITSPATLEERVAALEKAVAQLTGMVQVPRRFKDWRRAVGMFPANELQKEIDRAGAEIRAADRQNTSP